jgi:putative FmdB family regulatory protein
MPTYNYRCSEHGIFSEIVPYNLRNDGQVCPECGPGQLWPRTWEKSAPAINTSDSASIPDVVARGRFAEVRATRALQKAARKAGREGNKDEARRIDKEITAHANMGVSAPTGKQVRKDLK